MIILSQANHAKVYHQFSQGNIKMLCLGNPLLKIFLGFPRNFYITCFSTKCGLYQMHENNIASVVRLITSVREEKVKKLSKFTSQNTKSHEFATIQLGVCQ